MRKGKRRKKKRGQGKRREGKKRGKIEKKERRKERQKKTKSAIAPVSCGFSVYFTSREFPSRDPRNR